MITYCLICIRYLPIYLVFGNAYINLIKYLFTHQTIKPSTFKVILPSSLLCYDEVNKILKTLQRAFVKYLFSKGAKEFQFNKRRYYVILQPVQSVRRIAGYSVKPYSLYNPIRFPAFVSTSRERHDVTRRGGICTRKSKRRGEKITSLFIYVQRNFF